MSLWQDFTIHHKDTEFMSYTESLFRNSESGIRNHLGSLKLPLPPEPTNSRPHEPPTMLETYHPTPEEQEFKEQMLRFICENDDCFYRTNLAGHITGSAWVLSPDGTEVLMNHHAFLDMWMQFGGHADGESNIKLVALREAQEESGIEEIEFVSDEIFDIDIHEIPFNEKKGEPAHLHYDIRFLLKAKHKNFVISNESKQLKWMTPEEIKVLNLNRSIMRMVEKVFG